MSYCYSACVYTELFYSARKGLHFMQYIQNELSNGSPMAKSMIHTLRNDSHQTGSAGKSALNGQFHFCS